MKLLKPSLPILALLVLIGSPVWADDKDKLLEAWLNASTPGPEHKVLDVIIGEWTYTGKFWMEPGKDPIEAKGNATRKWVLDGRFVSEEVESPGFGTSTPFKGMGWTGYDRTQKKYIGVWIDSMSTGFSHSVGAADKEGKVLTFQREDIDPATGKKVKGRDVVTLEGKDKHSMVMYKIGDDGKEMKVMELAFTRKK
jgi:hypothetical protein